MIKVLFICTGNVFRSMIAEKCLRDFVKKKNLFNIEVDSAGIGVLPQELQFSVLGRLNFYNIDASNHKYKQITKELIDENDLIIAMNKNHQEFILKYFKIKIPLFYEVSKGEKKGVLDFEEFEEDIETLSNKEKEKFIGEYSKFVVDSIYNSIPNFVKNINKFI